MKNANIVSADPRITRRRMLRVFSTFFLAVGLATLGYACYFYASAYFFQKTETISLLNYTPEAPSIEHSVPVVPEGGTIGLMKIERLGLSAVVVEGDSSSVLRRGVGHVPGTAMPGTPGNSALSAHRDTFFRPLRNIQTGDVITLQVRGVDYAYEVESTSIVPPTAVEVLRSRGRDELTLITCYPFNYIGSAPNRFIVHAHKLQS